MNLHKSFLALFGGRPGAVFMFGAAASVADLIEQPDADLISVCATFCDLDRTYDTAGSGLEDDSTDLKRAIIVVGLDRLAHRMADLPCATLTGVQAMARALVTWDRELLCDRTAQHTGDFMMSLMVKRLLALQPPSQAASKSTSIPAGIDYPDADLIAVCSEYCASEAAYHAIYDAPDATDEGCAALAIPIVASWDGMLDRMAQLHATTSEGLAARAMALAQHAGIKPGTEGYPFAFEPDEPETITGRLLHMLLTDATRMIGGPSCQPVAVQP